MTTDITELAQSLKRRAASANEFGESLYVKADDVCTLVEALEKAQTINAAAEKLVRCKGRYHSEQNYRVLAALFGVTTPDLPPLDDESRTVTDWIEHDGRWRPDSLSTDELVYLKTRKQELKIPYPAGKVKWWMHTGGDMDVMAYKLASPQARTVTIEPFRSFVTDADLAALHRFAECCDDPESGGHDLEKEQVRRLEAIGALQRSGRISYITGFGDVLISITAGIKVEGE